MVRGVILIYFSVSLIPLLFLINLYFRSLLSAVIAAGTADTPPAAIAAPAAILTAEYVVPTPNANVAMDGPITPIIAGAVAGVAVPPDPTVTITNGIATAKLPIKTPQATLPVALIRITFLLELVDTISTI